MKPRRAIFVLTMAVGIILVGCGPSTAPRTARDVARGVALVALDADQSATAICHEATLTREAGGNLKGARDLAKTCADGHRIVVDAAVAIKASLGAWDDAEAGKAAQAACKGLGALTAMVSAVTDAGAKVPAVVADGIAALGALGRNCK